MESGGGLAFAQVCGKLLDEMMSYPGGWIFCTPVDPMKLNIPDYFSVIKKPMDLGTVRRNLDRGFYFDGGEFAADVELTFANAMASNPPSNNVHALAKRLDDRFKRRWESINADRGDEEVNLMIKQPGNKRVSGQIGNSMANCTPKLDYVNSEPQFKSTPTTDSYCIPMSPRQASRAAMLKRRFADTIFKATHSEFESSDSLCRQRARQRLEKEKQQQHQKDRVESESRVAKPNSKRLKLERERAAARMALEAMERSVVIDENSGILKELEMLCSGSSRYLYYGVLSPNTLQRIGLHLKDEFCGEENEGEIIR